MVLRPLGYVSILVLMEVLREVGVRFGLTRERVRVSILVLMEVLREVGAQVALRRERNVSILVLMEVLREAPSCSPRRVALVGFQSLF